MNPSECGNQDRIVVQEIIKEIAQSKPLETQQSTKPFKGKLKIRILQVPSNFSKVSKFPSILCVGILYFLKNLMARTCNILVFFRIVFF
jgi:hypothetical protein